MSLRVELMHQNANLALAVTFEAPTPGVTALFGPSGSGKTTVLNAIAGLIRPRRVHVQLGGLALHKLPTARRRIGYVFQDGRLFPHRTVEQNLRYGWLRARPGQILRDEVVDILGLGKLLKRRPGTLSGGERQRVAIGRALLSQPLLLLMDEPLSGLDQDRKEEILPYLARLRTAFSIPIIYASHAMDEVIRLADYMVLLQDGGVRAAGPLGEILSRVDLPMASRDDAAGVLRGKVYRHEEERRLTSIAVGMNVFWVPMVAAPEGTDVRLRVAARDVILALHEPAGISVSNVVAATVRNIAVIDSSHAALVELDLKGGGELVSRITLDALERLGLRRGERVLALIKGMSAELYQE
jgi:molybdate transport system ATP-binding protein